MSKIQLFSKTQFVRSFQAIQQGAQNCEHINSSASYVHISQLTVQGFTQTRYVRVCVLTTTLVHPTSFAQKCINASSSQTFQNKYLLHFLQVRKDIPHRLSSNCSWLAAYSSRSQFFLGGGALEGQISILGGARQNFEEA